MTIQIKATEQFFLVVLLVKLYNVVLPFDFVDEILKCDHSIKAEQCFSCGAVHYVVQGGSNFLSLWMKP